MIEIRTPTATTAKPKFSNNTVLEAAVGDRRISLDCYSAYGSALYVSTNGEEEKRYMAEELVVALQDFSGRVSKAQKEAELFDGDEPCVIMWPGHGGATPDRYWSGARPNGWTDDLGHAAVYPTVAAAMADSKDFIIYRVVRIEDLPAVPQQMYEVVVQKMVDGELLAESLLADNDTGGAFRGRLDKALQLRDEFAGVFNPRVQYFIRPVADDVN